MHVLCDTCVVLMLLRIAPAMFADERFGCTTLGPVWTEFSETQKFRTKYPWRQQYEKHIVPVDNALLVQGEFSKKLDIVKVTESMHRNERTGLPYGLSRVDREVAAGVLCLNCDISTTDTNLREFLEQQFNVTNILPLALINRWLGDGLIDWDDPKQMVVQDWIASEEPRQSKAAIALFETLTNYSYPTDEVRF